MLILRLIAWFALPQSVSLALLLVGIGLLWSGRPKTGRRLATLGTLSIILCMLGPVGSASLAPLEKAYPPLQAPEPSTPVRWVVVLGAGYRPHPELPATARIPGSGVVRFLEGVRLHRRIPESRLLVLLGGADANDGRVETVRELAAACGLPPDAVSINTDGRSTTEEAAVIQRTVGADPFILVTSAFHMPRAIRTCRERGLLPIPAPTDHQSPAGEYSLLEMLPSAHGLSLTQTATHEYLADLGRRLGW